MNPASSATESESFDFRSRRFCDDARTLARTTGCSLLLCRQELFIAEGDLAQAHASLVAGYASSSGHERLH